MADHQRCWRVSTNHNFARLAQQVLGVRLLLLNASGAREIEVAVADHLVARRASAFLLGTDPFFMTERDQLVALANSIRFPPFIGSGKTRG